MKSTHKRRITLKSNEPDYFYLVGISTTLKDYSLAVHLNNALNVRFSIDDHISPKKKRTDLEFPRFSFTSNDQIKFELISNRLENVSLLQYLRQFDIILRITGHIHLLNIQDVIAEIRKIKGIQGAYLLNQVKPGFYSALLEH